jgi:hypothetical protein
VFCNYGLWCPYSKSITDQKGPTLDHIVKWYLHNLFSNPHCIACCSQICPIIIIIIITIFNDLCSGPLFPSITTVYFYWAFSIPFPMQNLIQNSCIVIHCYHFQHLPTFCSWNCFCMFLSSSSVTGLLSFLFLFSTL